MSKKNKQKVMTAKLNLQIDNEAVAVDISVPSALSGAEVILPFVRDLSDKSIRIAVESGLKENENIACSKGCGECCAQLVPVTEIEIQEIAKYIDKQPKTKKEKIKKSFTQAKKKLEEVGMWDRLMNPQLIDLEKSTDFGLDYFDQKIYCPFLEDGACSIHPVRPLACREYLVTSDPKNCDNPREGNIDGIEIPTRISGALGILLEDDEAYVSSWVPLIVAPFWKESHPGKVNKKTGTEWVEVFLQKLGKVS